MDRRFAASRHPDAQLEWCEVRWKSRQCELVGTFSRQSAPHIPDHDGSQAPSLLVEGDHVAPKQNGPDLDGALPAKQEVCKLGQGLDQRLRHPVVANQIQEMAWSKAVRPPGRPCRKGPNCLQHIATCRLPGS